MAGLIELGAHVAQTHEVVPVADWQAARAFVASQAKPADLVAFAPRWVDPVGRERFGSGLATIEREARADESRFPRAFEVSIRGAHLAALGGWHRDSERRFGRVTVTTLENPAKAHVIYDLVSNVDPTHLAVSRVEGGHETPCPFGRTSPMSGGLGTGPALPAERFVCPGGSSVAESVVTDIDYIPHRCIFVPGTGGRAVFKLRFLDVPFGRDLHGHHALYVEAEHSQTGAPVTLSFKAGDEFLGDVVHRDGQGWKPFEFDTSKLAGQRGDLTVEIASPGGERRLYCFEADTR